MKRRKTREITIGDVRIGADNPVLVQSMTNTKTSDVAATVAQIRELEAAGCGLVRCAVPDTEAARAIRAIKEQVSVPIAADIHFDYRLALAALEAGADKLRINPGNIGGREKTAAVAAAAAARGVPIRVGVNAGSLEKDLLERCGAPTAQALVESAARHIGILEDLGFYDTVVSIKASDVPTMVEACRIFSERYDYPLHLGVTEAGLPRAAAVKSAMGIGALLLDGIGDTIRVSVTGNPREEIGLAKDILRAAGRADGLAVPELIACPTCGRTQIDLIGIAQEVEKRLEHVKKPISVAVMGCIVNGPGEGRQADVGLAGGNGRGVIFKKGEIVKTVAEDALVDALFESIETL